MHIKQDRAWPTLPYSTLLFHLSPTTSVGCTIRNCRLSELDIGLMVSTPPTILSMEPVGSLSMRILVVLLSRSLASLLTSTILDPLEAYPLNIKVHK